MRNFSKKGFTLVELLVVITILAIISVVAYQNFGGAVDKAVSGRKVNDVSTIETALQQFKADNNYFPPVDIKTNANLFGYNSGVTATASNKIKVVYTGQEIGSIALANGGGKSFGTGTLNTTQIGAKGTISRETLGKKYLSKDLYDPELGDLKINDIDSTTAGLQPGKMINLGLGRYTYSTFKKNTSTGDWSSNFNGVAYNIAYTIKKEGSDKYITKIVGDYDEESCYDDKVNCPKTLIGTSSGYLLDGEEQNGSSESANYHIPYAVTDFKQ